MNFNECSIYATIINISKRLVIHKQVKTNDKTELDNGVMTTSKRCSVLSFVFTCLCAIINKTFISEYNRLSQACIQIKSDVSTAPHQTPVFWQALICKL